MTEPRPSEASFMDAMCSNFFNDFVKPLQIQEEDLVKDEALEHKFTIPSQITEATEYEQLEQPPAPVEINDPKRDKMIYNMTHRKERRERIQ